MSNFIDYATLSQSDKEAAEAAVQEVMELVDDCQCDSKRIDQPLSSLKTVDMLAAYANVPYSSGTYNLYVAYKHSKLHGAVQSFIVQNTMNDEDTWILEDVSYLWDTIVRNLYASQCAVGNAATLEVLDFKEAFSDRKQAVL